MLVVSFARLVVIALIGIVVSFVYDWLVHGRITGGARSDLFLLLALIIVVRWTACTKIDDETGDAPGANDDASGTAVVLEAARALAPFTFDANLVFLLVPGEEQGLYGSRHFAER